MLVRIDKNVFPFPFIECGPLEFKDATGNKACVACGNQSSSAEYKPRVACDCVDGYYRVWGEEENSRSPCFHNSMLKVCVYTRRNRSEPGFHFH